MKKTFVLLLLSFGVFAQTPDLEKLDNYYKKMATDWDIPSVSVGIVKDGKLVFAKSYGVKEVGKNKQADPNSLYAIASNSKAFTSAIIGILVQEGKLKWTDKVKDHLPYFELYDPWVTNEVTIKDLLCHRVGLGTFSGDVIWHKANLTAEEIVKRVKYLPKAYDFRDGYGYSNVMYVTAGEVIKKVTGKTWAQNMEERIFSPLGMNRTITHINSLDKTGNFTTPHARENDLNQPIMWEDWSEIGAMGGIISSVEDLSKWMIFNLNNGIINGDTLISKQTRNLVWTPHNNFYTDHTSKNEFNRHFRGYGLGWGLSDYRGNLFVGHTGGYDGMISALSLIPDQNLGVVVLTNGMQSPNMAATYYAIDTFLGLEPKDYSTEMLERRKNYKDTRVDDIKAKQIKNTKPNLSNTNLVGNYKSDIYGLIKVSEENGELRLNFEHSPYLAATLKHWHYDTYEIVWDQKHAWFNFGTLKFNSDNNMTVKSMDFEVPNDDIFFEELKPYKVK